MVLEWFWVGSEVGLGWSWGGFGVVLGCFGVFWGWSWGVFGMLLECFWDALGVFLKQFRDGFGMVTGMVNGPPPDPDG